MMSHHTLAIFNKLAIYFPVFLIVFTVRGFFKALIAKIAGDDTPYQDGFLTLNPIAHIDVLGLTITLTLLFFISWLVGESLQPGMLVLLLVAFGVRWTIPMNIDETKFKNYVVGGILTTISGSLGILILAFTTLLAMKGLHYFSTTLPSYVFLTLHELLRSLIGISVWFAILDLIPIPPFGAGQILKYTLPYSKQYIYDWLEEYSIFIILILFFLPGVSDIFWHSLHAVTQNVIMLMYNIVF